MKTSRQTLTMYRVLIQSRQLFARISICQCHDDGLSQTCTIDENCSNVDIVGACRSVYLKGQDNTWSWTH